MQWDESDLVIKPARRIHFQLYDVAKGTDVGEHTIYISYGWETVKLERAGVMGRRSGRVRKVPHPPIEEGPKLPVEPDVGEKVFSGPWNPRFGDGAARFKGNPFGAQMVDDEIKDLKWEDCGGRHRGFASRRIGGRSHAGPLSNPCHNFVLPDDGKTYPNE